MTPKSPLQQIPADVVALADYERLAPEYLPVQAAAYLLGGAADEITLRDNSAAFQRLRLRPRVLRELAGGNTQLTLFGQTLDHPILLAPVAYQRLLHPQGELATVTAAAVMKAAMIVSTQASVRLEDIALRAEAPLWFQLYLQQDRGFTRELIQRAEHAGYRALVLTVDAPVNGVRNREQRAAFALPPGVDAVNLRGAEPQPLARATAGDSAVFASGLLEIAATWKDIEWLRGQTTLPVLLKGVLTPEDAVLAIHAGAAGIFVSNHGGRTLDTLPATLDALPAITNAVAGRVPLLLDGGIRRGTDVLKALALGASAVAVGRPCMSGLAVAGALGVAHVLHILRAEFEAAMALTGCRTLADIDRSIIFEN
ncbi:MAG: alpha-hydroxy-acid oxidizing protein [Chromatiales bacterium]|jgi:4-hydroxymandelate oxidase|nr:alpha-hydroxy-acid oxidizing protein [Chromatiales bacterium]